MPAPALAHVLRECEVCASSATLAEFDEVLMRSKFDRYQATETRREFAVFLRRRAALFAVSETQVLSVTPACRDRKGNQLQPLLHACAADVLISGDADLLVLHPWDGVPALTPATVVEELARTCSPPA